MQHPVSPNKIEKKKKKKKLQDMFESYIDENNVEDVEPSGGDFSGERSGPSRLKISRSQQDLMNGSTDSLQAAEANILIAKLQKYRQGGGLSDADSDDDGDDDNDLEDDLDDEEGNIGRVETDSDTNDEDNDYDEEGDFSKAEDDGANDTAYNNQLLLRIPGSRLHKQKQPLVQLKVSKQTLQQRKAQLEQLQQLQTLRRLSDKRKNSKNREASDYKGQESEDAGSSNNMASGMNTKVRPQRVVTKGNRRLNNAAAIGLLAGDMDIRDSLHAPSQTHPQRLSLAQRQFLKQRHLQHVYVQPRLQQHLLSSSTDIDQLFKEMNIEDVQKQQNDLAQQLKGMEGEDEGSEGGVDAQLKRLTEEEYELRSRLDLVVAKKLVLLRERELACRRVYDQQAHVQGQLLAMMANLQEQRKAVQRLKEQVQQAQQAQPQHLAHQLPPRHRAQQQLFKDATR